MDNSNNPGTVMRKPPWLKRRISAGGTYADVTKLIDTSCLHTVCQEAHCPNMGECFSQGTATFLILGDRCTRNCRFCAVEHGPEGPPDPGEPKRVAEAVKSLGLSYAVVTSVTRDDLPDGGAGHFAAVIREIRTLSPDAKVEVLIPDLLGSEDAIRTVVDARPDVLNHNLETVPRLYERVRPGADYRRSLDLLKTVKGLDPKMPTKSGLMLGLGETDEEITVVFRDLIEAGCGILTLGQYLQPSKRHLPVERWVPPEEFDALRERALKTGFQEVASGPFVRSSYHAGELFKAMGA